MTSLIEVEDLWFRYPSVGARLNSADTDSWVLCGLNLTITTGGTIGIVGESGSGKSTLVRVLCALLRAQRGTVNFDGRRLSDWVASDVREFRRRGDGFPESGQFA